MLIFYFCEVLFGKYSECGQEVGGRWTEWGQNQNRQKNRHPMGWQDKEAMTIERTIIKSAKLS